MSLMLVITTVATRDDALALARDMVQRRLAACVQLQAIDSVYRWQDRLHEDCEFRVLFKTTAERCDALHAAVLAQHPYELPALLAVPAERVHPAFDDWVRAEVDAAPWRPDGAP